MDGSRGRHIYRMSSNTNLPALPCPVHNCIFAVWFVCLYIFPTTVTSVYQFCSSKMLRESRYFGAGRMKERWRPMRHKVANSKRPRSHELSDATQGLPAGTQRGVIRANKEQCGKYTFIVPFLCKREEREHESADRRKEKRWKQAGERATCADRDSMKKSCQRMYTIADL